MHLTMTWLRISSVISFEERSSHGIFRHIFLSKCRFSFFLKKEKEKRWLESFCQECEIYIFWIQLSCKIQFCFSWNVNFVSSHVLTYELITGKILMKNDKIMIRWYASRLSLFWLFHNLPLRVTLRPLTLWNMFATEKVVIEQVESQFRVKLLSQAKAYLVWRSFEPYRVKSQTRDFQWILSVLYALSGML